MNIRSTKPTLPRTGRLDPPNGSSVPAPKGTKLPMWGSGLEKRVGVGPGWYKSLYIHTIYTIHNTRHIYAPIHTIHTHAHDTHIETIHTYTSYTPYTLYTHTHHTRVHTIHTYTTYTHTHHTHIHIIHKNRKNMMGREEEM